VSVQALSWVLERCPEHVGPQARLVLMSIANHAGPRGEDSYPSVATIGRETGLNARQVQRWTAWLADEGLLEVERQAGGDDRIRADRRPNRYTIVPLRRGVTSTTPRAEEAPERAPDTTVDPENTGPADGVTPTTPGTPERGDISVTPPPSTGCHPRHDGVTLKAPRGDTDATQTVIEPNYEPRGTSPSTTSSRAATPPAKDQDLDQRPVERTRARDLVRRARRTITAAESVAPVAAHLEADHALAAELGLIGSDA